MPAAIGALAWAFCPMLVTVPWAQRQQLLALEYRGCMEGAFNAITTCTAARATLRH